MRRIEIYRPFQNPDRTISVPVVTRPSDADGEKEQPFRLFKAFGAIENSPSETIAMKIIDRMGLSSDYSKALYFYHLWSEDPKRGFSPHQKTGRRDQGGRNRRAGE